MSVNQSILAKSRSMLASQLKSLNGVWRTTDDGSKIFITSGGEVRAGGPSGKVIAKPESKPKSLNQNPTQQRKSILDFSRSLLSQTKSAVNNSQKTVAAGLAVIAKDTGRLLLLQRALSDSDHASGKFEFPGGHLEDDEQPLDAAIREWEEETGLEIPKGKQVGWYKKGIYEAFFWLINKESQLEINPSHKDREVTNPDDPKGKWAETAIWFDVEDMVGSKAVRQELQDAMNNVRQQVYRIRREHDVNKGKPRQSQAKSCGANAPGGGGFQQGNTCGSSKGESEIENQDTGDRELENGGLVVSSWGSLTLWRAADSDEIDHTVSFGADRSTAEAYQDNPGFGGANLYRAEVDPEYVFDLYVSDDPMADLLELLGMDELPRHVLAANTVDVAVPQLQSELEQAGIQWVRVKDTFPDSAETWIWISGDDPVMEGED